MESGLYNLLFNFKNDMDWFQNELSIAFHFIVSTLEANCGVAVLLSEDSNSYQEYAASGYTENGHFYSFLARGMGNFERLQNSILPLVFFSRDCEMYYDYTDYTIVSRVYYKKMYGFVLFEFTGEYKEINAIFAGMLADKIAHIFDTVRHGKPEGQVVEKNIKWKLIETILEISNNLKNDVENKHGRKILYIKGSSGVGKKSLSKYIHRKLNLNGDFIVINSIPNQLVKLEKSLYDWSRMVGDGVIVFEKLNEYNLSQQRLLYEFIQNSGDSPKLHFIQSNHEAEEIYKQFYRILEENSILIPSLNTMSEVSIRKIVKIMFEDIIESSGRVGLRISEKALSSLSLHYYMNNLKELRNILEYSVLKAKQDVLDVNDLDMDKDPNNKSIGLQDVEDLNLRRCVDALERQKILLANKLFGGNQVRMAKALGISRGSLQYKMKQMEL